jgi:hypothetical protein
MIGLEAFGESAATGTVAQLLDRTDGVSRVRLVDATRAGNSVVLASVRPRTVDTLLGELRRQGVPDGDITLTRVEVVGSLATRPAEGSLVWADVLGTAWLNARPIARYLAFMVAAGPDRCAGGAYDREQRDRCRRSGSRHCRHALAETRARSGVGATLTLQGRLTRRGVTMRRRATPG